MFKDEEKHMDTASSDFGMKRSDSGKENSMGYSGSPSLIESLQQQLMRLTPTLCRNELTLQKVKKSKELSQYIEETKQQAAILEKKNKQEQNEVKLEFGKDLKKLQQRAKWWHQQKKQCKQREEKYIIQSLDQLKISKEKCQKELSSVLKETGQRMKNKMSGLMEQLKEFRRCKQDSRGRLMGQLQQIRGCFQRQCEQERMRRIQYQEIVMTLLDRTCDQGERLLRRIC